MRKARTNSAEFAALHRELDALREKVQAQGRQIAELSEGASVRLASPVTERLVPAREVRALVGNPARSTFYSWLHEAGIEPDMTRGTRHYFYEGTVCRLREHLTAHPKRISNER